MHYTKKQLLARNRRKSDKVDSLFYVFSYTFLLFAAVACMLPFLLLLSGSLTDESIIIQKGFSFFPEKFSTYAYQLIFIVPDSLLRAYGVSIFVTLTGTLGGLFLCSMTAYVLYRKEFIHRNKFAFFFYFTTLFNGGLISSYILMVRYLQLKDSLLALILPNILPAFYILIMRTFIKTNVDYALIESAKIDGAQDFAIYSKIVLPVIKPVLASIGLFYALQYWNDWGLAMLYISNDKIIPLQYLLYRMLNRDMLSAALSRAASLSLNQNNLKLPSESFKLAMTVIAIGPIVFVYPFIQRFFVRGLTIGAVKG